MGKRSAVPAAQMRAAFQDDGVSQYRLCTIPSHVSVAERWGGANECKRIDPDVIQIKPSPDLADGIGHCLK